MRKAIAMIELIFAMVIIAISVMTIPTMVAIGANASKGFVIDEDIMARMSGWVVERFQARWDQNYGASGSGPLSIVGDNVLDCTARVFFRNNTASEIGCDAAAPSIIPALGSGNLSQGIEQLNGGAEAITITPSGGTPYTVNATYSVAFVNSTIAVAGNTATATWTLGSSTAMNPGPSGTSHLKRVVTRFNQATLDIDTTLTFFKSNKGN